MACTACSVDNREIACIPRKTSNSEAGSCILVVEGDESIAGVGRCKHGADESMEQRAIAVAHSVHRLLLRH